MGNELKGNVAAVLMSPDHGYPTYPQRSVRIEKLGIPGDAHSDLVLPNQEHLSQMIDQ